MHGTGVVLGKNVKLGKDVVFWNYVVVGDDVEIGDNTRIGSFCDIGKNVKIGKNCNIQAHVTISNLCKIGDNVFIGPATSLMNDRYPDSTKLRPVEICDGAIIGGGVIVLPDVVIGEKAVVAGGSLVTNHIPPKAVVKGAPARVYLHRDDYDRKKITYEAGEKRPISDSF